MCGIIGIIGRKEAAPRIIEALRRLEYRGYDSAGVATVKDGAIERRRAEGKLVNLEKVLAGNPLEGKLGIGHTRWATHGAPTEINAHPHSDGRVAVVHNGIIENFQTLRDELTAKGCVVETDTDTEVVAHLIGRYLDEGLNPRDAVAGALKRLEGAFALAILFAGRNDLMIGAGRGSPLAVGFGDGEMFLGSDALALAPLTRRIMYLEDGDWAVVTRDDVRVHDEAGRSVEREVKRTELSGALIGKAGYRHFMAKEIHEQPQVIGDTLNGFIDPAARAVRLPGPPFDPASLAKVTIVACGTSYYAGLTAKYWFERLARVPVEVDVASEFRYRAADMPKDGLALFISQSGETADTLAALRRAKERNQRVVSIVNVSESAMARESHAVLQTRAGPEIGVASTKAFTTQLTVLACLAVGLARSRGAIGRDREAALCEALAHVPAMAARVLNHDGRLKELASEIVEAGNVLYIGRGTSYPIALEGALKLKEISYIHAEGHAAGEMKHGPIALIDELTPVIVIAPSDDLFDKTASNMREVVARGGRVIFLSDRDGCDRLGNFAAATIALPTADPFVAPILYAIPVQLLAYHVAVSKGTDVDQPRNLAKSVTVE